MLDPTTKSNHEARDVVVDSTIPKHLGQRYNECRLSSSRVDDLQYASQPISFTVVICHFHPPQHPSDGYISHESVNDRCQGIFMLCLKNENIMEGLFSKRKEEIHIPIYLYTYKDSAASEQPGFLLFRCKRKHFLKFSGKIEKIKMHHSWDSNHGSPAFRASVLTVRLPWHTLILSIFSTL